MKVFLEIVTTVLQILCIPVFKTPENIACQNFYEYACSNYAKNNPDPNYSEIIQELDYKMNVKLLEELQSTAENKFNFKEEFENKMLLYFESCRNIKQRNVTKYFEEIKPNSELNWPLMDTTEKWLDENKTFDYWPLLGDLQSYGFNNVIVKQNIIRNKNNSLSIWLEPADVTLPDNDIIKAFLEALNIRKDYESIIQQLRSTELQWQNIMDNFNDENESDIVELNFNNLSLIYPKLNLQLYFKRLLNAQELENISVIFIKNRQYFEYLNHKNWSKEELMNLSNYLLINFLYYLAEDGAQEFTNLECLKDLRNKFDLAINFFYYDKYFKHYEQEYRFKLSKTFHEIEETMLRYFNYNYLQLSCMQRNFLKDKLKSLKINVGNLPRNRHSLDINIFYQDLEDLHPESYYKNHLLLLKHRFLKSLYYSQNQSFYIWPSNQKGSMSSPFYVPQQNMVVIPLGSFQKPLFYSKQTNLQRLALFGFVLAHEIAHAFDTTGLQYDANGLPLKEPSGIMENYIFLDSLKCFEYQNSTENIDERIADNFAVRVAYLTYFNNYRHRYRYWQKDFFINLAQFFCGKDDLEFLDHDSDQDRLHQIVGNLQEFSNVFSCPYRSPMNLKNKCCLY